MKYETSSAFDREWRQLSREQLELARPAFSTFVAACNAAAGRAPEFPPALRVKRLQGTTAPIWEMTWNFARPDGRATFEFIEIDGETAVRWRRIGGHDVFDQP